jgi:rhodanese-related sulfurtransferase
MNQDKKIILIGTTLFALVAFFTFVRPMINQRKDSSDNLDPVATKQQQYPFVSVSDLKEEMGNVFLIDSRAAIDFYQEHLIGSQNITAETITQSLAKIDRARKIIIIGADSNDISARNVAESLRQTGLENFAILSGGITAWTESGGQTFRLGTPSSLSDKAKISILKPEEVKSILDSQDSRLFILDLRSSGQYSAEHLPGAKNIPASELENQFKTIPLGKNIVFYTASDLEAFQMGVALFDLGYPRSSALEGGLDAWKAKGYPTEK